MEIIRGRLSAADFSNPSQRYNADTDTFQYTPDNGANWYDSPEADPRHSSIFRLPPLTTTDPRCDAAANMVKWIKDFIDNTIASLEADAMALTLTNNFLTTFATLFPPALLLLLLQELATSLFTTGSEALSDAFTSGQYDLLLCIFYCNMDANGSVTADNLTEIETEIAGQLNTAAALIVDEILFIQGEVGLSNAGAIGSETGDCDGCPDCGWCMDFNFLVPTGGNNGGFSVPAGEGGTYTSSWVGTNLNSGNNRELVVERTFTATDITYIAYNFRKYPGGSGPNNAHGMRLWNGATMVYNGLVSGNGTGFDEHIFTTPITATKWQLLVNCGMSGNDCDTQHCHIEGLGVNPLGVDNC